MNEKKSAQDASIVRIFMVLAAENGELVVFVISLRGLKKSTVSYSNYFCFCYEIRIKQKVLYNAKGHTNYRCLGR